MASSSATALVAVALVAAANAVEWFPLASTGMEYMYSNQQVDYQGALAACAKFGPDASVASPTNQEAADMLYNLAPESGAMYQGRYLGLVNQNTNCKGVPPTFKWASGAVSLCAGRARLAGGARARARACVCAPSGDDRVGQRKDNFSRCRVSTKRPSLDSHATPRHMRLC